MTRSLGRWVGIVAVSAGILFIPLFTTAQSAVEATAEEAFWRAFGQARVVYPVHRDKDCDDFANRRQAQHFFRTHGRPAVDPHDLDAARVSKRDGRACTRFDY